MLTSLKNLKEEEVTGIVRLLDALSKFAIMLTFCVILLTIVIFFVYGVVGVEQPMKDMAPNDKLTHDLLKIIATSIFSVLATVMGARAMMPMSQPCAGPMGTQPTGFGSAPLMQPMGFGAPVMSQPSWTPPPAPRTPPVLEDEEERLRMAHAREHMKNV